MLTLTVTYLRDIDELLCILSVALYSLNVVCSDPEEAYRLRRENNVDEYEVLVRQDVNRGKHVYTRSINVTKTRIDARFISNKRI